MRKVKTLVSTALQSVASIITVQEGLADKIPCYFMECDSSFEFCDNALEECGYCDNYCHFHLMHCALICPHFWSKKLDTTTSTSRPATNHVQALHKMSIPPAVKPAMYTNYAMITRPEFIVISVCLTILVLAVLLIGLEWMRRRDRRRRQIEERQGGNGRQIADEENQVSSAG